MFRLARSLIGLVVFAVVIYAAVTVPIGKKTLWQHARAIAGTEESRELVDGVKTKAEELKGRLNEKSAKPTKSASESTIPQDRLDPADRQKLKRLIREELDKPPDRG